MTTFDYKQAREFSDALTAKLDQCETAEGLECANLDAVLACCADCCCKLISRMRQWARDVFAAKVAFDPAAEQLLKAELANLESRALNLMRQGEQSESDCYTLEGRTKLAAALFSLRELRESWVTPAKSVAPGPRLGLPPQARHRAASLPPLPPDWTPDHPQQKTRLRRT